MKGNYDEEHYIEEEEEMDIEEVKEQDEEMEGDYEGNDVSAITRYLFYQGFLQDFLKFKKANKFKSLISAKIADLNFFNNRWRMTRLSSP